MAVRRRLGNLAQVMLQDHLLRRRQEHQSSLVGARQKELSEQGFEQSVLGRILQDPTLARRLSASGRAQVGGFETSMFVPEQSSITAQVGKGIAEISDPEKLPTEADVHSQLHSVPGASPHAEDEDRVPIEQLMAQVAARRDAALAGLRDKAVATAKPEKIEALNPDGSKTSSFVSPFEAQPFKTGLSTSEQIAQTNQIEAGTRAEHLRTVSGEANARAAAEWLNPAIVEAKIQIAGRNAAIAAERAGRVQDVKAALEGAQSVRSVIPLIKEIELLSEKVNVFGPSLAGAAGRGVTAVTGSNVLQMNPDAVKLNRLRMNVGRLLGNNPYFGGNRGAQSEADAEAIAGRLPSATTEKSVAKDMLALFNKQLTEAMERAGDLDPSVSYEERVRLAREAFQLEMQREAPISGADQPARSPIIDQLLIGPMSPVGSH